MDRYTLFGNLRWFLRLWFFAHAGNGWLLLANHIMGPGKKKNPGRKQRGTVAGGPEWEVGLMSVRCANSEARLHGSCQNHLVTGFTTHSGRIAVYNADNVDTDRIIPARFLSMTTKSGYGELLFKDVRGGDFPLDRPEASGASILVVGTNFGCGSSREHAVWAIQQAGFRCVIAKRLPDSAAYSDIFRQNSANCGLLLIELPAEHHDKLAAAGSGAEATVDLPNQTVTLNGESMPFEINAVTKDALVKGLDLIGTTLMFGDAIDEYEKQSRTFVPSVR
jgi:3-isopropylmalate/(R)-2-methylmalate dehydratase small subunit